jgi:inorganic pyrophosphatase
LEQIQEGKMNGFLNVLPASGIMKYSGSPPKDAIAFSGYPQQHPTEKNKLILVYDPLGLRPTVIEFKMEDVLFVEEVRQAVTETGEGVPLVKLWIRKGAHGMILEPFEVNDPVQFAQRSRAIEEHFLKNFSRPGL